MHIRHRRASRRQAQPRTTQRQVTSPGAPGMARGRSRPRSPRTTRSRRCAGPGRRASRSMSPADPRAARSGTSDWQRGDARNRPRHGGSSRAGPGRSRAGRGSRGGSPQVRPPAAARAAVVALGDRDVDAKRVRAAAAGHRTTASRSSSTTAASSRPDTTPTRNAVTGAGGASSITLARPVRGPRKWRCGRRRRPLLAARPGTGV